DVEIWPYFSGPSAALFTLNIVLTGITFYNFRILREDVQSASDTESTRKSKILAKFWPRFYLQALICGCWVTKILGMSFPPLELWGLVDTVNQFQGVFIFFIFLTHQDKRALMKEKIPMLLKFSKLVMKETDDAARIINAQSHMHSKKMASLPIISHIFSSSSYKLHGNETSDSSPPTGVTPIRLTYKDTAL
ncbi:unnamed protein product, partial [Meganyctiphanes norvegica]